MPTTKEFSIHLEDRPGTLGKVCRALADRNVNIIAFQSSPIEGKSLVHLVVDNPTTARTVLDSEKRRTGTGHHSGREQWRRPDAWVHECGIPCGNAAHRRSRVFQPVAKQALEKGRIQRAYLAGSRDARRLRCRRATRACRGRWAGRLS